ncbi:Uncharacterized protein BP5553_02240 [Venustampulla echinocandica]|uniref:Centromere protein H C-terminal domain-containing protein n=1 Tax=Venustampulla echinocandica TaxID=2656787 RepID=A0A370U3A2_9HELO|nr:Uncharacterized protein BP5553_02240 [Venustampulla echinocandica]RDL42261.1 Uncharacterized protein BP5553_02240 [Venustampulla echinocandica]
MAHSYQDDMMGGADSAIQLEAPNQPLFSEQEQRVLDLYERMEELQLEIALLKVQGVLSQDMDEETEASQADINTAQQDLLKAKAAYQVRNSIIENVLVANPILKAVHSGNNATIAEQDLLPLVKQRDTLSGSLTELNLKVRATRDDLAKVEAEHIVAARQNAELAGRLTVLAEQANAQKRQDVDPKKREQLAELEANLKASRQKWRIMKGTATGTIVGSGVDWVRDPKLLEVVLDDDDAGG